MSEYPIQMPRPCSRCNGTGNELTLLGAFEWVWDRCLVCWGQTYPGPRRDLTRGAMAWARGERFRWPAEGATAVRGAVWREGHVEAVDACVGELTIDPPGSAVA